MEATSESGKPVIPVPAGQLRSVPAAAPRFQGKAGSPNRLHKRYGALHVVTLTGALGKGTCCLKQHYRSNDDRSPSD